jgi:hypothetical protein
MASCKYFGFVVRSSIFYLPLPLGFLGAFAFMTVHDVHGQTSFALHLNPIFHYNYGSQTDTILGGTLRPFSTNIQLGLEINHQITPRVVVSPFLKFYGERISTRHNEFFGYLDPGSYTYGRYTFTSIDVGALGKYSIAKKGRTSFWITGGVSYAFAQHTAINFGHHLEFGDASANLEGVSYAYSPSELGTNYHSWKFLAGVRAVSWLPRFGVIEYGLLVYIPTKTLPTFSYRQRISTYDQGLLQNANSFSVRQISLEPSISYYFLNFDRNFKLVHLKKEAK